MPHPVHPGPVPPVLVVDYPGDPPARRGQVLLGDCGAFADVTPLRRCRPGLSRRNGRVPAKTPVDVGRRWVVLGDAVCIRFVPGTAAPECAMSGMRAVSVTSVGVGLSSCDPRLGADAGSLMIHRLSQCCVWERAPRAGCLVAWARVRRRLQSRVWSVVVGSSTRATLVARSVPMTNPRPLDPQGVCPRAERVVPKRTHRPEPGSAVRRSVVATPSDHRVADGRSDAIHR
jgi:hypothetical protein